MTRREGNEGSGRLPGSWTDRVAPTALKMAASWERARRGHWSIIFIAGSAVIRSALEKNEITECNVREGPANGQELKEARS